MSNIVDLIQQADIVIHVDIENVGLSKLQGLNRSNSLVIITITSNEYSIQKKTIDNLLKDKSFLCVILNITNEPRRKDLCDDCIISFINYYKQILTSKVNILLTNDKDLKIRFNEQLIASSRIAVLNEKKLLFVNRGKENKTCRTLNKLIEHLIKHNICNKKYTLSYTGLYKLNAIILEDNTTSYTNKIDDINELAINSLDNNQTVILINNLNTRLNSIENLLHQIINKGDDKMSDISGKILRAVDKGFPPVGVTTIDPVSSNNFSLIDDTTNSTRDDTIKDIRDNKIDNILEEAPPNNEINESLKQEHSNNNEFGIIKNVNEKIINKGLGKFEVVTEVCFYLKQEFVNRIKVEFINGMLVNYLDIVDEKFEVIVEDKKQLLIIPKDIKQFKVLDEITN